MNLAYDNFRFISCSSFLPRLFSYTKFRSVGYTFSCKRRNESIVYGTTLPAWRLCGGVICSLLTFYPSARWQKNTAQFVWAIFIFSAIRHFQSKQEYAIIASLWHSTHHQLYSPMTSHL